MSWYEIGSLGAQVAPITSQRPPRGYRRSNFDTPMSRTVSLLARELRMLDAERIVIEIDLRPSQIRHDGMPRADARVDDPTVILSFDSKWGPQRYATAEFDTWQDNLRAVALSLEALRAVDRYGVSKRGEQYQGWKALPVSTDAADSIYTREQAQALIDTYGSLREAILATHPDHGGDEAEFRKVMRAREVLG